MHRPKLRSRHRTVWSVISPLLPKNKKAPVPPYREQGQAINSCGTTLFAEKNPAASSRCQHTVCPITGAHRPGYWANAVLLALSGPFAAPLFAPVSAIRGSLWMRSRLYFRLIGLIMYGFSLLNYRFVSLSRTFFFVWRTKPGSS